MIIMVDDGDDFEKYLDSQLISMYLKYGDDDAFVELLRRYEDTIEYVVRKVHLAGYDKDDVRQVCVMTFLMAMKSYDPERGASFGTYVRACMRNRSSQLVRDSLSRRRNPEYMLLYSDSFEVADERVSYDDSHVTSGLIESDMREVMESILSEKEYLIFMDYTRGFTYNELAEKYGMTRKQIDNTIFRARKKLSGFYTDF